MSTPSCCSSQSPSRDDRLAPPADACWFIRWLKLHAFYQILATICRRLTYRDYYNTLPELHPQTLSSQFTHWQTLRPHWSNGQICFRIISLELFLAHLFAVVVGGLKMGCTQILVNLVYYVTSVNPTEEDKMTAVRQLGYYILIFFIRVLINEQSSRLIHIVGIKVDTLLHLRVYDKLMRVSKTYLKHLTEADLLYLFRGETKLIYDGIRYSASLSSGLTTIILAQVFLYIRLGAIGMILLPVIILSLTFQILINHRKAQINHEKLPFYHDRLAMNIAFYDRLGEIKSMGWEEVMMRKNKEARGIQNKKHLAFFIYQNIYLFTVAFIPTLLMTFFLLAAESSNQLNTTSPRRAYTVYTYIIMIELPLRSFPYAVVNIFQAINAAKHLFNFFSAEEYSANLDHTLPPCSIRISNLVASIQDPNSISLLIKKYQISSSQQSSPTFAHLMKEFTSKQYEAATMKNPQFKYYNLLFRDITIDEKLEFKRGDRVMILTLDAMFNTEIMKAIIGHLKIQKGEIKYNGKIGYINSEEFHFLRESIRRNILFKEKEDVGKLGKVYRDLELDTDFNRLSKGAETVITDSNILLSVIQKKKISLARSLYNGADILLLDSFFEDIEPDEVMELYDKYTKLLADKLLMITTKRVYFFKPEDKVIIMEYGRIVEFGVYRELLEDIHSKIHDFRVKSLRKIFHGKLLPETHRIMSELSRPFFSSENIEEEIEYHSHHGNRDKQHPHHDYREKHEKGEELHISNCPVPLKIIPHETHQTTTTSSTEVQTDRLLLPIAPHIQPKPELKSANPSPYITCRHYATFVRSSSIPLYLITLLLITASTGIRIFTDWWIGTYSNTQQAQANARRYIGVYIGVNCVSAVLLLLSGLISPFISLLSVQNIMSSAMRKLFQVDLAVIRRISRLAISYLLSKDNEDFFYINEYIFSFWRSLLLFLGTFIILGLTTYVAWIVGGVLFIANLLMMYFFRKAFMELFDLADPFRNEYNQILEDIILSTDTIRTQNKQEQFRQALMDAVYHVSAVFKMNTRFCSHGLSLFGELVTIVIVITIGYVIIEYKGSHETLTVGQIILASTSLSLSSRLPTFILQASNDFVFFTTFSNVSIKMLVDKIRLLVPKKEGEKGMGKSEEKRKVKYKNVISNNSITIQNVTFRSVGQKLDILQDINLKIQQNTLVGFYTGYTGDIEALFYIICSLIKPIKSSNGSIGKVLIGNLPIQHMTPQDILANIMLLNHNPVIFNGTLRQNIDPYCQYPDSELIFALKQVQFWQELGMNKRISEEPTFGSLNFNINFLGKDLPMGYTTKINIARAIVKKPKILLMFYAVKAAPVYLKDELRESIYRNLRGKSTILMATLDVAELLKCDYLVGLEDGRVDEKGTPEELLKDGGSRLSRMIDYLVPMELIESRRDLISMRVAEVIQEVIKRGKYYY